MLAPVADLPPRVPNAHRAPDLQAQQRGAVVRVWLSPWTRARFWPCYTQPPTVVAAMGVMWNSPSGPQPTRKGPSSSSSGSAKHCVKKLLLKIAGTLRASLLCRAAPIGLATLRALQLGCCDNSANAMQGVNRTSVNCRTSHSLDECTKIVCLTLWNTRPEAPPQLLSVVQLVPCR
jgi:hypothetical protein